MARAQVPDAHETVVTRRGQVLAVGGQDRATDQAVVGKGKQFVTARLLPKVTPFKAAQVLFASLGQLMVEQVHGAAGIARLECEKRTINVSRIGVETSLPGVLQGEAMLLGRIGLGS